MRCYICDSKYGVSIVKGDCLCATCRRIIATEKRRKSVNDLNDSLDKRDGQRGDWIPVKNGKITKGTELCN